MYDKTQIGQQLGIDISSLSHEDLLISDDIMYLMRTLMSSTGNYICSRIEDQKHRYAYKSAMVQFIEATQEKDTVLDMQDSYHDIKNDVKKFIKPTWFSSRQREQKYYYIACEHALDIINKISIRFVIGGYDSESRKHKGLQPVAILHDLKVFSEDK